mmetsp:Transcript_9366/g.21792  ORF Transcript_9366/g.21792 Transcript_9366/m.21792 type:complete len:300 (-) Transcript_9366:223-1122(-)
MGLDLFVLEEVRSKSGADEDVNLVLGLETGGHLLVRDLFSNGGRGGVSVFFEKLLRCLHGEGHGIGVVQVFRSRLGTIGTGIISLILVLFLLLLILRLFLLLLVLGFLVLLLLLLVLILFVTVVLFLVLLLVLLALLLGVGFSFLVLSKDVGAEFVAHIDHFFGSTSGTLLINTSRLNFVFSLGKTAVGTEHERLDVLVHQVLQDLVGVVTIHNCTVRLGVVRRLRPQLAAKELIHLARIAVQRTTHVNNIGNDGLTPVATTLLFAKDECHFVAVFRIIYRSGAGYVHDSSWSTHLALC